MLDRILLCHWEFFYINLIILLLPRREQFSLSSSFIEESNVWDKNKNNNCQQQHDTTWDGEKDPIRSKVLSGFRKQNNPLNKRSSRSYTWEAMFELLKNAKQFPKHIKYLIPINIYPSCSRLLVLIISQTLSKKSERVLYIFPLISFLRISRLDLVVASLSESWPRDLSSQELTEESDRQQSSNIIKS